MFRDGLSARATIVAAWYVAGSVAALSFVAGEAIQPSGRSYSAWDFFHLSLLVVGGFAISSLLRLFPLSGPRRVLHLAIHICCASLLSTAAGVGTAVVMGLIDGFTGYQHLLNTASWYMTPGPSRLKVFLIEQLFYFSMVAGIEWYRRIEQKRAAETKALWAEAQLAHDELFHSQNQIPPEYLREVFRSLAEFVERDTNRAVEIIGLFARFLRQAIDALAAAELTRSNDVSLASALTALESRRLGRPIEFRCALSERQMSEPVAALELTSRLIRARAQLRDAATVAISQGKVVIL